ncbi:MAG: rhomboid family intramembrane serine protease [Bacteroidales bacterium]|nr:rhomboid family intramembrane serine protease [Bacteroidales bacterium]
MNFKIGGFGGLTPAVKNLLIINVLFFLATFSLGRTFNVDLIELLGLRYFGSEKFAPYQFITYMFMHGGFTHIFFNMFALWMFGRILEQVWGPKRFLIYYFVTGIGAAIVHYAVFYYQMYPTIAGVNSFLANPDSQSLQMFLDSDKFIIASNEMRLNYNNFVHSYNTGVFTDQSVAMETAIEYMAQYKRDFLNAPLVVGASGAVYGILLAFGMLFPNTLLYIYFAIPIKAKYFVIIYGALELYLGISNQGGNIAHFAHLGGMIFGFILIKIWRKTTKTFY